MTDDRWPTDPGELDTTAANNRRHEEWLGVPEWPSKANNWLSRKGHPLTPVTGEPYHHAWIEERALRDVLLQQQHGGGRSEHTGSMSSASTVGAVEDDPSCPPQTSAALLSTSAQAV